MSYAVTRRGFGQGDSTVCAPQDWNPTTNTCQPGWNKQGTPQPSPAPAPSGSDLLTQFENWVQGMTAPSPAPGTGPSPTPTPTPAPAPAPAPAAATDNTTTYLLVGGIAVVGVVALVLLTK